MEALAIFGVACNVLQVLGSVEQAIKLGRLIYKSRSVDPELTRNITALDTCMQDLSSSLQSSVDAATQDTKDLVFIAKECLDCGAKTKEQLQKISDLAPVGNRLGALRAWLAAVSGGKRKLDELERTMRARQRVLETQLLVRICKKSDAVAISSRDSFDSLNSTLQSFVLACMQGQITLDKIMKSQSALIKAHVSVEASKTREATKNNIVGESHRIGNTISMTLQTMRAAESSKEECKRLQESLQYPGMESRRNQIKDPYEKTFEWIFELHSRDQDWGSDVRWSDFRSWLRATDSPEPYWVSGKAGCGKSTLMKFLAGHKRTYENLSTNGEKVKVLSHYIWAAGHLLERSVAGLLFSLLDQLLWGCDELSSLILNHFNDARKKRHVSDWSVKNLEAVLIFTLSASPESFCLFVDGIDEADDQIPLIGLVQRLGNMERVRVCLSSRPEPVLRKHFQSYPFLYMQDLTARDIKQCATGILRRSSLHIDGQLDRFVQSVCEKSDGVFLWAVLAIKSLELGTYYEETTDALMARLDTLPRDLEQLYLAMWTREVEKNPAHQKNACLCLSIMLEYESIEPVYREQMDIALMTLMLYPSLAIAFIHEPGDAMVKEVDDLCEETLKVVDLRTAGLLEVSKEKEVRWIHRSAHTFLCESPLAQGILHTDKRTPQERRRDVISGVTAYILICAKPIPGHDSDTSNTSVDADSVHDPNVNSMAAKLSSTWAPLSFQFRLEQDVGPCFQHLLFLRRNARMRRLPDSEVRSTLSLAEKVYRSGRWPWVVRIAGSQASLISIYCYKYRDPDFIGAAAALGFFDYVWASMGELYAASPADMEVSARYEDYILKAIEWGREMISHQTLSVLRLMQLMAENMKPVSINNSLSDVKSSRGKRRFQIENDVFTRFSKYALQLPPSSSSYYIHRVMVGLLHAGYSQDGSMLMSLRRDLRADERYDISWVNHMCRRLPRETFLSDEGSILIQSNAKTILLLFLAGVREGPANGSPIFSEIIAAAENVKMPFLFRLIGLGTRTERRNVFQKNKHDNSADPDIWEDMPVTFGLSFQVTADFCASGRDTKSYEHSNLKAIQHATMEAVLSDPHHTKVTVSTIVVPGLKQYIRKITPELRAVSNKEFDKLLLQNGIILDQGRDGKWPPQTYSPIEPAVGTAPSPT